MTQKDLLYLEDAIGHETNLVSIYEYYVEILQDTNLKAFLKSEIKKHQSLKTKLLKTMEDIANEW